ncbi:MAG: 4Fe-4S binding protein [Candidatus Helarchaeota archaeon]
MSEVTKFGVVLVIGGGVAGIQASLDLADLGFKVYLLDSRPNIGGKMAQLDKTFPTNDCSICILAPKIVEIYRHPNIELLTNCEVTRLRGTMGNYEVTIEKKPRYVEESICKNCGDCAKICPVRGIPDEFNEELGTRCAIFIPSPQAVPPVYSIDAEHCLYLNSDGKVCGACSKVCQANAINFRQKKKQFRLNVGALIVATGIELFDISKLPQYGHEFDNVISSMQYERLMCASGPTQGQIVRPSDRKHAHKIAFLSCVASRNPHKGVPYCSSVCCMYLAKEAIITKEHDHHAECIIFRNDIRAYGKGFNEYIMRAQSEYGVKYIYGQVSYIEEDPDTKNLILYYEDIDSGESREMIVDLVVLATALIPSPKNKDLARVLGIELDEYGFFKEHSNYATLKSTKMGIMLCGCATGPRDIPESVANASAAAAKVSGLLSSERGKYAKKKEYLIPEKPVKIDDPPRIGIMVCHCGSNIAGFLDSEEVAQYAKTLPNVEFAESNLYTCSSDTQERIKQLIQEKELNRFIVASCTPRTHEPLFAETCKEGGLNPYLFEFVNLREQCSWVHMNDRKAATEKAKDLVRIGIAKARLLEPLQKIKIPITKKAVVIGGGISGCRAALDLAEQGFETHLISNELKIGGFLRHFYKLYTGETTKELIQSFFTRVMKDKYIYVHESSTILDIRGYVGNFETDIKLKNEKVETIKSGAIIVAIGARELVPDQYKKNPNILTLADLEERIAFLQTGVIPTNGSENPNVVFYLCYNSRQKEGLFTYCSNICCKVSLKNINILKELNPDANIYVLYRDIQAAGKENETFYRKSRENATFIRYSLDNPPRISTLDDGSISIEVNNILNNEKVAISANLVVLATPMIPNPDAEKLSALLKVPLLKNNPPFFLEAHVKLRPLDFATEGIFLCGSASFPKLIPECMAQASGAAARAARLLSQDEIEVEGITSYVDPEVCIGCGTCVEVCPYGAISLVEVEKQFQEGVFFTTESRINPALCKGCGTCVARCPVRAISQHHFETKQITEMIKSVFMP